MTSQHVLLCRSHLPNEKTFRSSLNGTVCLNKNIREGANLSLQGRQHSLAAFFLVVSICQFQIIRIQELMNY